MQNLQASEDRYQAIAALTVTAARGGRLRRVVLSKPDDKACVKCGITLRRVGGNDVLQAETLRADNKALHENLPLTALDRLTEVMRGYAQINLLTTAGDCELRRSKGGKQTLTGDRKLEEELSKESAPTQATIGNNRQKQRILQGDEPFLRLLDVSDANGRIHDKKQSKFRQINRFLELIRDCLPSLPAEGELRICDLCCGKSYLSFAAYHYFANVLKRKVCMTGVDLKPDVIDYCNGVAKQLGFDGKSIINPRQIAPIHNVFRPSDKDIEKAIRIIAASEEAAKRGSGVVALDGKMIDKPIVMRAQRVLTVARAMNLIDEEV